MRTDTGDMEPPGVTMAMASCPDTGRILGAYNQPVTPAGARETLDSQIILSSIVPPVILTPSHKRICPSSAPELIFDLVIAA